MDYKGNSRFLDIYLKLSNENGINKSELAKEYEVSEKTIQRDIEELRYYLERERLGNINYNKSKKIYEFEKNRNENITNKEALAICKILLESKAFCEKELDILLKKIINQVEMNDKNRVNKIIGNEKEHYVEPFHKKELLENLWELSEHIANQEIIEIEYTRKDGITKTNAVKPVSLMFSEFYFYLVTFMVKKKDDYPTIFRVDRILKIKNTKKHFSRPYKERFEDGEFRKRVQFMFSGPLRKIKFEYKGLWEVVKDRLPTAKLIEKKEDGVLVIEVEVFGDGIEMWFGSQGKKIKILEKEGDEK